jgi:glucose/arabinose dehydrogenase
MKTRSILILGLLTVFALAACAPAAAPAPEQAAPPSLQETEPPAAPTEAQPAPTEVPPTEAPADVPQAVATSRGPDLEATDPATVSLTSGELQLVEFFRFT